jgi:hypothetical protein
MTSNDPKKNAVVCFEGLECQEGLEGLESKEG